jgi:Virulence factor
MTVEYQIIFWRDIPAQVKLRAGGKRFARSLTERFEQAIDQAAMQAGLAGTDAYLAELRTSSWNQQDGEPQLVADGVVSEIESEYPPERLSGLVETEGRDEKTG